MIAVLAERLVVPAEVVESINRPADLARHAGA